MYLEPSPSMLGTVESIPMTETPILIETSFADGIAIIAAAAELPGQARRHWTTSLRQIAKALDKPLEVIPARYSAVRADLAQLHEVPAGLTKKTLANHKSNAKSALLWLAREKGIPKHGTPLTPAWEELRGRIRDSLVRSRLSSLMRFCSANNIPPIDVDEAVVDRFLDYRSRAARPADRAARRLLARAWNANIGTVPGWPARVLVEPPVKAVVEVEWQDFPEGLRADVERYLGGLTRVRRGRGGQRIRPLKPSTIRTRRAELQAAARMAVKTGVPVESLNSLAALLAPDVAEKVVDAYWSRNGEIPKLFTIDLAGRFLAIAISTFAPVRLANLTAIKLGFNLIKPGGPNSNYWLVFPRYDVKNRVKLEYPLEPHITRLIDEYVHDFRPTLLRGRNEDWLFPGQRNGAKQKDRFADQIAERIFKATGVRMTVHQF